MPLPSDHLPEFTQTRQNDFQWKNLYMKRYGVCSYPPPIPKDPSTTTATYPTYQDWHTLMNDLTGYHDPVEDEPYLTHMFASDGNHDAAGRAGRGNDFTDRDGRMSIAGTNHHTHMTDHRVSAAATTAPTTTSNQAGWGGLPPQEEGTSGANELAWLDQLSPPDDMLSTTANSINSSAPDVVGMREEMNELMNTRDAALLPFVNFLRHRFTRLAQHRGSGAVSPVWSADTAPPAPATTMSAAPPTSFPPSSSFVHRIDDGTEMPHEEAVGLHTWLDGNPSRSDGRRAGRVNHNHDYTNPWHTSSAHGLCDNAAAAAVSDALPALAHCDSLHASVGCAVDVAQARRIGAMTSSGVRLGAEMSRLHDDAWLSLMDDRLLAWIDREVRDTGYTATQIRQRVLASMSGPGPSLAQWRRKAASMLSRAEEQEGAGAAASTDAAGTQGGDAGDARSKQAGGRRAEHGILREGNVLLHRGRTTSAGDVKSEHEGDDETRVLGSRNTAYATANNNNNNNNTTTTYAIAMRKGGVSRVGEEEGMQRIFDSFMAFFAVISPPHVIQHALERHRTRVRRECYARTRPCLTNHGRYVPGSESAAAAAVGLPLFSQFATWREAYTHRTAWRLAPFSFFLVHDASMNYAHIAALYALLQVMNKSAHVHTRDCLRGIPGPVMLRDAGGRSSGRRWTHETAENEQTHTQSQSQSQQAPQAAPRRRRNSAVAGVCVKDNNNSPPPPPVICPLMVLQQITEDLLVVFEHSSARNTLDMLMHVIDFVTECVLDPVTAARFLSRSSLSRQMRVQSRLSCRTASPSRVWRAEEGGGGLETEKGGEPSAGMTLASSSSLSSSLPTPLPGPRINMQATRTTLRQYNLAEAYELHVFTEKEFNALFELSYWFVDAATGNARQPCTPAPPPRQGDALPALSQRAGGPLLGAAHAATKTGTDRTPAPTTSHSAGYATPDLDPSRARRAITNVTTTTYLPGKVQAHSAVSSLVEAVVRYELCLHAHVTSASDSDAVRLDTHPLPVSNGNDDDDARPRLRLSPATTLLSTPLIVLLTYIRVHGATWLRMLLTHLFNVLRRESVLLYVNRADLMASYESLAGAHANVSASAESRDAHRRRMDNGRRADDADSSSSDTPNGAIPGHTAALDAASVTNYCAHLEQLESLICQDIQYVLGEFVSLLYGSHALTRLPQGITALLSQFCHTVHMRVLQQYTATSAPFNPNTTHHKKSSSNNMSNNNTTEEARAHSNRANSNGNGYVAPQRQQQQQKEGKKSLHHHGSRDEWAHDTHKPDTSSRRRKANVSCVDEGTQPMDKQTRSAHDTRAHRPASSRHRGTTAEPHTVAGYLKRLKQDCQAGRAFRTERADEAAARRLADNIEHHRLVKFILFDSWILPALNNAVAAGHLALASPLHLRWNIDAFARYLKILVNAPFVESDYAAMNYRPSGHVPHVPADDVHSHRRHPSQRLLSPSSSSSSSHVSFSRSLSSSYALPHTSVRRTRVPDGDAAVEADAANEDEDEEEDKEESQKSSGRRAAGLRRVRGGAVRTINNNHTAVDGLAERRRSRVLPLARATPLPDHRRPPPPARPSAPPSLSSASSVLSSLPVPPHSVAHRRRHRGAAKATATATAAADTVIPEETATRREHASARDDTVTLLALPAYIAGVYDVCSGELIQLCPPHRLHREEYDDAEVREGEERWSWRRGAHERVAHVTTSSSSSASASSSSTWSSSSTIKSPPSAAASSPSRHDTRLTSVMSLKSTSEVRSAGQRGGEESRTTWQRIDEVHDASDATQHPHRKGWTSDEDEEENARACWGNASLEEGYTEQNETLSTSHAHTSKHHNTQGMRNTRSTHTTKSTTENKAQEKPTDSPHACSSHRRRCALPPREAMFVRMTAASWEALSPSMHALNEVLGMVNYDPDEEDVLTDTPPPSSPSTASSHHRSSHARGETAAPTLYRAMHGLHLFCRALTAPAAEKGMGGTRMVTEEIHVPASVAARGVETIHELMTGVHGLYAHIQCNASPHNNEGDDMNVNHDHTNANAARAGWPDSDSHTEKQEEVDVFAATASPAAAYAACLRGVLLHPRMVSWVVGHIQHNAPALHRALMRPTTTHTPLQLWSALMPRGAHSSGLSWSAHDDEGDAAEGGGGANNGTRRLGSPRARTDWPGVPAMADGPLVDRHAWQALVGAVTALTHRPDDTHDSVTDGSNRHRDAHGLAASTPAARSSSSSSSSTGDSADATPPTPAQLGNRHDGWRRQQLFLTTGACAVSRWACRVMQRAQPVALSQTMRQSDGVRGVRGFEPWWEAMTMALLAKMSRVCCECDVPGGRHFVDWASNATVRLAAQQRHYAAHFVESKGKAAGVVPPVRAVNISNTSRLTGTRWNVAEGEGGGGKDGVSGGPERRNSVQRSNGDATATRRGRSHSRRRRRPRGTPVVVVVVREGEKERERGGEEGGGRSRTRRGGAGGGGRGRGSVVPSLMNA